MRTIGVISDTHGLLRPQALQAMEGSDLILHAGDVGEAGILRALNEIAPTYAVYGNTDHGMLRARLPHSQVVDLTAAEPHSADRPVPGAEGMLAYVLHIKEELDLDPAAAGVRMVVFGHTHEPLIQEWDGLLWMNPGSAGPKRFSLPVTVGRVIVEDHGTGPELAAEIIHLDV